jgi:cadmium resistance protein CadD (predicted permease)
MPYELLPQITIAILVFISTNVDDIFLLAAFFADKKLMARTVVLGQLLGIGALVAVSTLVAWLSMALPEGWISLLGLVPLYLGLKQIKSLWTDADDATEDEEVQNQEHQMARSMHSQLLAVAGVTIANGGDNLGVYIPLFANSLSAIPLFIVVFAVMTLMWCLLGYLLVNNKVFGHWIRRYGHKILPVVLILLGLDILSGALVLVR